MRTLPRRFLSAVSDATIGTAIVMMHVVLADRSRQRSSDPRDTRAQPEQRDDRAAAGPDRRWD